MLNLVQLQERLKDLPMQAVMQYANGANPQVPPFLALGELNRRKKMQESAAMEQAQEMAGAPSIKEQIEQATGLMALQGSRQRMAAQQQQSAQRNIPMPAPNTTTSEPAQLAGGGYIDEVPRDYQAGGIAMNPEALKKLMMMKAMQAQNPGIAGIPMDMFKRQDYAGGGIVAFQRGGLSEDEEERIKDELRRARAVLEGEEIDPADSRQMMRRTATERPDANYGNEGRAYPPGSRREFYPGDKPKAEENKDRVGIGSIFEPRRTSIGRPTGAVARALGLKPEDVFPMKEPRTFAQARADQQERDKMMGISEGYIDDREKRLAAIEAQRAERRAQEPMEQIMEFLGGVAEARGGNWATQGAKGAKAAIALRNQQRNLREKQDMEMDELRYTIAAKRDAIRRGDKKDIETQTAKEEDLKRAILKDRADMAVNQARIETGAQQAQANILQATRPTELENQKALYLQHTRETGEKPTAAGFQKFLLGTKASTIMTQEDALRIAAQTLGPGATEEELIKRADLIMKRYGNQPQGGAQATPPANRPPITSFQK